MRERVTAAIVTASMVALGALGAFSLGAMVGVILAHL